MTESFFLKTKSKKKKYQTHSYIFYEYEMYLVFVLFFAESYKFRSFLCDRNVICCSW